MEEEEEEEEEEGGGIQTREQHEGFRLSAAPAILTRDIVTCFSVAPWHYAQYNESHVPKLVAGKTDINDSLEKGLHILKEYVSI